MATQRTRIETTVQRCDLTRAFPGNQEEVVPSAGDHVSDHRGTTNRESDWLG